MSVVVCLYDETGYAGQPWAEAGHTVLSFDLVHKQPKRKGTHFFLPWDADAASAAVDVLEWVQGRDIALLMAFPPCTDLSAAGALHFARKATERSDFQTVAARRAYEVEALGKHFACPWFVENPVGVLPRFWRKPDCYFHPYEYGGYLEGMERFHPDFDGNIPAQDAYTKKTLLWTGGGFVLPAKRPVKPEVIFSGKRNLSRQMMTCGGGGERTKRLRSATPRGFAKAVFLTMSKEHAP